MPNLEVYRGTDLIGSFILAEDFITIGRSGNNDIVLPDNKLKVSRYHAVLIRNPDDPERYVIRDLSSAWGTEIQGGHIFQKKLGDEDIIRIVDFKLKYAASTKASEAPFKITEEPPNLSLSTFSSDIGDQNTITQRFEEAIGSVIPGLSIENKVLFEELLYRAKSSSRVEGLLDSAMDFLFYALEMKEGCSGCVVLFEAEDALRCSAKKGMESRATIPLPRLIIADLKAGKSVRAGNQLWIPLIREGEDSPGFLFLCQGPYKHPFDEDAVKLASFIVRLMAYIIGSEGEDPYSEEESIKWPREMIGGDQIFREIKRIAPLGANVLLLGKTGVGKEVTAEEIHRHSERQGNVLKKVNCPTLQKELVESELFGHKKGAFTGAIEDKRGDFELANGGTIFLDEVADLPWESQRKVLRAIREKVIKRLGEEREIKVDVRVIAATNRDLHKDMEEGRFGSDLYFSFGERISIPPLRERKKDIPLLAHYFLDKYASERDLRFKGITFQAMRHLLSYTWPGNIRELENCISQALSKSIGVICFHHLPDEVQNFGEPDHKQTKEKSKPKSIGEMEKAHIIEILQHTRGNKEKAAEVLKISKPTLYSKIKKYSIVNKI